MRIYSLFAAAFIWAALVGTAAAQVYFYPNGVFVGIDAKASFLQRQKKIAYGLWDPGREISPTEVRDAAPSPSLTFGYKFDGDNSISVRTAWAGYSIRRSAKNDGSMGAGFGVLPIDGSVNMGDGTAPAAAHMKWDSDALNGVLEYQRRLWSDEVGAVLGLLGFSYRFEGQKFQGQGATVTVNVDRLEESLDEHLFGPYAGLKVSFLPSHGSKFSFSFSSDFGYYLQSASLRAREVVIGTPLSVNDRSSRGTSFADAGANVTYLITSHLSVGLDYRFNWIHEAGHIENPTLNNFRPVKIGTSEILDHRIGLDLVYRF